LHGEIKQPAIELSRCTGVARPNDEHRLDQIVGEEATRNLLGVSL
jgi:hypothetical protein